jgi:hypothetical protein
MGALGGFQGAPQVKLRLRVFRQVAQRVSRAGYSFDEDPVPIRLRQFCADSIHDANGA